MEETKVESTVETVIEDVVSDEETTEVTDITDDTTKKMEELEKQVAEQNVLMEELQKKAKEAEETSFKMLLQSENLTAFEKLFTAKDKQEQLAILKQGINEVLVAHSYVPTDKAQQDAYSKAIETGDVNTAIRNKLSKLFK
ncbi:hypothetical protein MKZ17_10910 [Solibacillus sp. FSL R7-0682]|uniref:hypothetical protein n=1 Tax=Solibacillus sp. FSL R7-0682 TaxID=2921690 RepID=UPI0030FCA98C